MTFRRIDTVPGAICDTLAIGTSRVSVIIDRDGASIAMHDGNTRARVQCAVCRDQLLALAGLMTDAAARLSDAG